MQLHHLQTRMQRSSSDFFLKTFLTENKDQTVLRLNLGFLVLFLVLIGSLNVSMSVVHNIGVICVFMLVIADGINFYGVKSVCFKFNFCILLLSFSFSFYALALRDLCMYIWVMISKCIPVPCICVMILW